MFEYPVLDCLIVSLGSDSVIYRLAAIGQKWSLDPWLPPTKMVMHVFFVSSRRQNVSLLIYLACAFYTTSNRAGF